MMNAVPSGSPMRHVLIVDDSAGVRRAVQESLSPFMQVTVAESVPEALAALTPSVGLVLSDIRMPGESGLQLADRLRRDHPDLPVLLFTGVVDLETRAQAQAVGVGTVLRKPLTREVLLKTVQDYLGHEPAPASGPPSESLSQPEATAPMASQPPAPVTPPVDALTGLSRQPGVLCTVRFHADGRVDRTWNLPLQESTLETLHLLTVNLHELAERLGSEVLEGHLFPLHLRDRIVLLGFLKGQGVAFIVRSREVMERVTLLLGELRGN